MDIYYIYSRGKSVEPVKSGFSITAVVFGIFWLLYQRAWLVLGSYMFLGLFVVSLSELITYRIDSIFHFATSIALGLFATEIVEHSLKSRNYRFRDSVIASSSLEAKMKFLSRSDS